MTRSMLTLLGTLGAAGLLAGAFAFQYIGGLAPCTLCHWQRYGHVAAVALGVAALVLPKAAFLWLASLGALSSAGVAVYHTGVERKWWEGPSACSGGSVEGLSADELFEQVMNAPLVRCDEIPWELFGLSMANLNILASLVVAALFAMAARARA